MLKSVRPRVGLILMAVVILGALVVPAASAAPSAGTACPPVHYRIVRGDYLSRIASRYGVTIWQLQRWNGISNVDRIYAGQVLVIYPSRCAKPAPPPPPPPPAPCPGPAPAPCPGSGSAPCPGPAPAPCPGPAPAPCSGPSPCPNLFCTDQRAVITSPGPNAWVSGWVTITGNATHENFAYYKLEYGAGSNPTDWSWFFGGQWPIWHGTLGGLNAGALAPGNYTIRVVVVDKTGNYPPPCQVTIVVR